MEADELPSRRPDPWQERAACKGVPTDIFFPAKDDEQGRDVAMGYCRGNSQRPACPVRQECLEFALSLGTNEPGIYGGTTQRQRRRILAKRPRPTPERLTCPECGVEFSPSVPQQRYCKPGHARRVVKRRYRQRQQEAS